jgi:hypothetical protein
MDEKTNIMKTTFLFALLTLTFMGIFYACTKTGSAAAATTNLKVRLTDNPYNAQEVNVDLKEVRVNYKDSSEWSVLSTNAGVYNLLRLQNGLDTLIASGTIPGNFLGEIRFVLGTNNSIRIKDVVYPLTIPSGSESGLKLKVGRNLNDDGSKEVTIDFDAALSVHQDGNGNYILKPVLKLK